MKLLVYLCQVDKASTQFLSQLAQKNVAVVVSGLDLQASQNSMEILDHFKNDQLQVLSVEVEDEESDLYLVTQYAEDNGYSHIFQISCHDEAILPEITNSHLSLKVIFYTQKESEKKQNNPLLQRLLDVGSKDYRSLVTTTLVWPVEQLKKMSFKKDSSFLGQKLLIQTIQKRIPFEEKALLREEGEKKKLSWVQRLFVHFYSWWLLALSSLHRAEDPLHSSLSFAMGAFLACTPFYGLQTFMIIMSAIIFRLNFPIAFLGSQISLPPIYALLVPLELYVGLWMTGRDFQWEGPILEVAQNQFMAWLFGALVMGGILATLMGGAWYWVHKKSLSLRKENSSS